MLPEPSRAWPSDPIALRSDLRSRQALTPSVTSLDVPSSPARAQMNRRAVLSALKATQCTPLPATHPCDLPVLVASNFPAPHPALNRRPELK